MAKTISQSASNTRGFTLIELMITLVVVGVLAALAAPSFTQIIHKRVLKGASDKLFADMHYAKSEAIKRNKKVHISFSNSGTSWCYGMAVDASCDCSDNVPACELDGVKKIVSSQDYSAPINLTLSESFVSYGLAFEPLRSKPTHNGHVALDIYPTKASAGIDVSITGRIRMCSNDGTFGYEGC
jgi:prepilin-type N-terminal cleavage/methylation domain-containing protein